jgi:hypothetical protein
MVDSLVRACADVQVLATSREALGLTGEIGWRVPSLSVPDARRALMLTELAEVPAVQLFVERVTAFQPHYALSERNSAAVAQICRRLDFVWAALREANGAPLGPAWQPLVDRWLAISRQALGEQAAAEAWAAGRHLSFGEALAEAAEPLPLSPVLR